MPVVGSRFGNDNQYTTGNGKGFTVVCNDCGLFLSNKDLDGAFCVFCEQIAVFTCHGCKQESHIHNALHCTREVSYVQEHEEPLDPLRDSKGEQGL